MSGTSGSEERLAEVSEPRPFWPRLPELAEVYAALVTGVRDYVHKNGFASVIVGLSGGIDSALTATIAADAIGPERVHVVLMPSRYSSDHSVGDAEDLAKRRGLHARTVPIQAMVEAYDRELDLTGLAEENLQSRIRGVILMGLSNAEGHLVLTTGNKSELATGYSTLYGDSAGGYAPIKDVPKTLVWELARWRNQQSAGSGRDPADPGELDHQAAQRRARARPAGQRLAARLHGPRRAARRLRRAGHGYRSASRRRRTTLSWSSGSSGWSTGRSTSEGSTRPARRSARRTSAGTAACRSPASWREPLRSAD